MQNRDWLASPKLMVKLPYVVYFVHCEQEQGMTCVICTKRSGMVLNLASLSICWFDCCNSSIHLVKLNIREQEKRNYFGIFLPMERKKNEMLVYGDRLRNVSNVQSFLLMPLSICVFK